MPKREEPPEPQEAPASYAERVFDTYKIKLEMQGIPSAEQYLQIEFGRSFGEKREALRQRFASEEKVFTGHVLVSDEEPQN